jgi:type IV pilus assembly protein PilM
VSVREISFGSRRLREALQRERGLTADEAEEMVQGRSSNHQELDSFVTERADELAVGIERAAAFVAAQTGGTEVSRVFLSGGGARVPGMVEALADRLRLPVKIVSPLERVAVRPEVMQSHPIDELAPMLMMAVGLAMRRT